MTIKELDKELNKIDPRMDLSTLNGKPYDIRIKDSNYPYWVLYDFNKKRYYDNGLSTFVYGNGSFYELQNVIEKYWTELRMTNDDLENRLMDIDGNLFLYVDKDKKPSKIYYVKDTGKYLIYDFKRQGYQNPNCHEFISDKINAFMNLIDEYWMKPKIEERHPKTLDFSSTDSETIPEDNTNYANHKDEINKVAEQIKYVPMVNPFAKYTEKLATVLKAKNVAYGDSFTKSVDDYGLKVIGIRLSDKYNRIKHLVNAGELKENDESLEDTLLDNAGYSILALKYLKEHKKELEDENH